jgi:hypothetical protein
MRRSWLSVALLIAGTGTAVAADDYVAPPPPPIPSPITDHFALSGIYFWGHVSTFGQFGPQSGPLGTPFYAESALGVTDKDYAPLMEIMFRMADRSRLRVDFFDMRRGGDTVLSSNLTFGDDTFAKGQEVQSEIDWREMDITYTFSFLKTSRFELGAGLGVSLIEAEASAQAPGTPELQDFSGATPFPTIALDGTVRITRRWSLNARGQYFNLAIKEVSGTLGIYHADLQFRAWPNVAFGAGYSKQSVNLSVVDQDPSGEMRLNISGPEAFVRVSF